PRPRRPRSCHGAARSPRRRPPARRAPRAWPRPRRQRSPPRRPPRRTLEWTWAFAGREHNRKPAGKGTSRRSARCDLTSNRRRLPGVHSATRGGRASSGAVVHHVYLVPGFFGFGKLGALKYCAHVREYVVAAFARRGLGVHVDIVKTRPTASLTRRAERVVSAMAETLQDDDGPVHLIGHSSGGLDVRLLLSPGVTLPTDLDVERYARQVRTAITVATPHHGTPLAGFFTSLLGQKLLQVLSLATISILRFGHLPLSALVQLGAVVARMDGLFGLNSALLDEIFAQLLADFSPERRRALAAFFREVGGDQALLVQL